MNSIRSRSLYHSGLCTVCVAEHVPSWLRHRESLPRGRRAFSLVARRLSASARLPDTKYTRLKYGRSIEQNYIWDVLFEEKIWRVSSVISTDTYRNYSTLCKLIDSPMQGDRFILFDVRTLLC